MIGEQTQIVCFFDKKVSQMFCFFISENFSKPKQIISVKQFFKQIILNDLIQNEKIFRFPKKK